MILLNYQVLYWDINKEMAKDIAPAVLSWEQAIIGINFNKFMLLI